jgi:hypothetical protein
VLSIPGSRWSIAREADADAGASADAGAAAVAPAGSDAAAGAAGSGVPSAPARIASCAGSVSHATLAPPRDSAPPLRGSLPREPESFRGEPESFRGEPERSSTDPARSASGPLLAEDPEPYAFLFGDLDLPASPAAPAYVLELPGGALEPLTAPLLLGRSPSDPGHDASGGAPRLVAVAADDKDISRTHARVEVAGGAIVVTDLDSKNGTRVAVPGTAPRTLRAGEPAVVLPGTVIDLGGGVVMTVREEG